MIVTEEEAKTKRCQEGFGPASETNRDDNLGLWTQPSHCIASECMAWRWQNSRDRNNPLGYCGKAGKA